MADDMQKSTDEVGWGSKALKLLGFPIAAISGYWSGSVSIRNSAYDNAKEHGLFDDFHSSSHDSMKNIGAKARQAISEGKPFDILTESVPLHTMRDAQIAERLEKVGLGNFEKQWKFTSRYQKQNALLNGLTVAGIAIGAIFSMAHSKAVQKLFTKHEPSQDNDGSIAP